MAFDRYIPESEIHFIFSRSGGAGGQNVNKTSTKAILHWCIEDSKTFSIAEKDVVRSKLKSRLTMDDEVVVVAEEERSQPQNRARAIEKLQELVRTALIVRKKRVPTKPSRTSRLKLVVVKKKHSLRKQLRRKPLIDE